MFERIIQLYGRLKSSEINRKRPFWTDLRGLSNTQAVRLTIFLPIVGYWIILNERVVSEIADLTELVDPNKKGQPSPPWRLFATYFGLSMIAVGSGLYQLFCPREVKENPDPAAYASRYTGDLTLNDIEESRIVEALEKGDEHAQHSYAASHHKFNRRRMNAGTEEMQRAVIKDGKAEVLQIHFDLLNSFWYSARITVLFMYLFGFFVLAFPAVDIFRRVVGIVGCSIHTTDRCPRYERKQDRTQAGQPTSSNAQ
jgi:hypothetical protein